MNTKNLWIAVLSGAVLTTLVSNLPFVGFINCLLCAGFWGSAIFAVWLYRRLSGELTVGEGVRIGALTGLCAGILGFALSFLGLAGAQGFVSGVEQFLPAETLGDVGIATGDALIFNLLGVLFNIIFGTVGGWIGAAIFRPKRETGV
ncbi:MAG: hypothetical protein ACK2US_04675 [Anaerolineae bacterium]|jgi:hypothetical protein